MPPTADAAPLPRLDDFPHRTYDKLRYADTDRQGHVNNAVFATFLETGRAEMFYDGRNPLAGGGAAFVIADLALRFVAEINWPGRVEIGTGVVRIGRSSVGLDQALFQGERCVATAATAIVQMDEATRRSAPLSDAAREILGRWMMAR